MRRSALVFAAVFATLTLASFATTPVEAAPGKVSVSISGLLRGPLGPFGSVNCSATVALAPDPTNASLTVGSLSTAILARGATQTASAPATLNAARNGFACTVWVLYNFPNVVPGQKFIVTIDVKGQDPGNFTSVPPGIVSWTPPATIPGHARQVVAIIDPPATDYTRIPATGTIEIRL